MCYEWQEAVFNGKPFFHWMEKAEIVTLTVMIGKPTTKEILNCPLVEKKF